MTNATFEGNHWTFTSFTIVCMLATFALGWCLLKEFILELLETKDKDKLYADIMHVGVIVLIFNISKFYLLLCFRKKIEIVDLVDSETDKNSKEENNVEEGHKNCEDSQDQVIIDGQNTKSQGPAKEQDANENGADQKNKAQNFSEKLKMWKGIQEAENVEGDDTQVQGQISMKYEGIQKHVSTLHDIKEHMHDSGKQNIQPVQSARGRKKSERFRSQSMCEGQNYASSKSQDDKNIEPHKIRQSIAHGGEPGPSKTRHKNQSISNIEKTTSLYDLRHKSCFS